MDYGLFGVRRKLAARQVDLGADVFENLVLVEVRFEFQANDGQTLPGHGVHLFDALDRLKICLERFDQQAFGVFGADARIGHNNRHKGDGDVWVGLPRHRIIGH